MNLRTRLSRLEQSQSPWPTHEECLAAMDILDREATATESEVANARRVLERDAANPAWEAFRD